jgi:lipopolysaccharide export system permease protein
MKLLDRYIIKQFLITSFFALLAVILIFIVIDVMENLGDFLDRQATVEVLVKYYFFFIPEIIKLITPVAVLLGSLFVTARLSTQNEWTAMKAGGVSLYRLIVPYLAVALVVSAASVYFNGWIVPKANKKKLTIERVYLNKNTISGSGANIYVQDTPTRILSIGYFDDTRETASRVSIQDFSDTNATVLVARVDAQTMEWDSVGRRWLLRSGVRRWFSNEKESIEKFDLQPAGPLHFNPDVRSRNSRTKWSMKP